MSFRLSPQVLVDLVDASVQSAVQLSESSQVLLKSSSFHHSAFLSSLCLEECGKVLIVDGLLRAKQGSERANRFKSFKGDHEAKLDAAELLVLLLGYWSFLDSQNEALRGTIQIIGHRWREQREALAQNVCKESGLRALHQLKLNCMYANLNSAGQVERPSLGVSADDSTRLSEFAKTSAGGLSFVWNHIRKSYSDFIEKARSVSPQDEEKIAELVAKLLPKSDDDDE